MNRYLKTGLIAAFILALILIPTCIGLRQPKEAPKQETNVKQYISETKDNIILNEMAKDKHILQKKCDSLLLVKQKVIQGKERVRDSLIYISDSTCKKSINILYYECVKTDSVNNSIISNLKEQTKKDSTSIAVLTHKVLIKQDRIVRDSTRIVQLNDTLPKVKRKGFIKGFFYGFGSGASVTKGVEIISKIKP